MSEDISVSNYHQSIEVTHLKTNKKALLAYWACSSLPKTSDNSIYGLKWFWCQLNRISKYSMCYLIGNLNQQVEQNGLNNLSRANGVSIFWVQKMG